MGCGGVGDDDYVDDGYGGGSVKIKQWDNEIIVREYKVKQQLSI